MKTNEQLPFLIRMRRIAKEARSRKRRCRYSQRLRERALDFLEDVEKAGGTLEDAAEMMSVHRPTLLGWLDRATRPTFVLEVRVVSQ